MKAVRFFAVFFAILLATLLLAAGASADVLRLPDGVKIIETEAFRGDTSLDEVVLPEGIERIESGAFAYSSVKSINLPDSLVSIDSTAFEGVQGLSVTAKAGTVGYEWAVAQGYIEGEEWISSPVENFTFNALSDTTCEVTGYNGNDTDIVIPRIDSDGKTVVQIGAFAFSGNKTLMSVCIPATVNSIQDHAFRSCSSLMSIIIPDGVSSIGSSAFYSCTSLTNITFPDSMASIYDSTFNGCTSLKSFNVSAGNTVFASLDGILTNKNMTMIYRCPQAKEGPISIPNGIIGISNYAFCDCIKVTSIAIPDGVTNIGNRAFYNCTGLTSINIPDGVTNIGSNAFYCCKGLISITIPKGVTYINGYTFYECTKLTSVILPDGVVSIGDEAFYHCTELRDINISDAVTDIGSYAFCGCKALTGITIPANLTTIGQGAFSGCSGLTGSIILPDGVNSIPNYAFSNCSGLTDITIPESVQYISKSAFTNTNEQLQFIVTPGSYAETWLITNGYIKSAPEIASVEFSATEIHYTDGDQYSFLALTGSYNMKANAKSNIECHWYISDTPDFEDAEEYGSYYGDVHYPMSFTDYPFGTEFHYGGAQYADTWYVWVQAQNDYGTTMVGPFAAEKTDAYTSMYVTLTGLVTTEDGTPIPGVRVYYYFDEDISTYTDGEGRWTFEHWDRRPEGQIVCFTHPDYHFELESFECGYFSTVEEHPTVIGYPVELTGSFDDDYVELEPGEIMQVAGSVTSGGSYHNYLGRVSLTIDGYHVEDDDSDRYASHDFQYDYVRMISLADYEVFKLDTTKEPLNVPGTYTVQLWAATAGDDNGRILDSMTVIVGESTSSLHGLVQTPAGSPIDGAYVIGVNTDNEEDYFFVRTGSNGQWSASGLTAGATYELSAYHPDYDFGETVAVTPDEETHVLTGALQGESNENITFTMEQDGHILNDGDSIVVGTSVNFVVTVPEAAYKVRLVVDGVAYESYTLDADHTVAFTREFSKSGMRQIQFQICVDWIWTDISATKTLIITSAGKLTAPVIHKVTDHYVGADLHISWDAVEHASSYTVYVYTSEMRVWPAEDAAPTVSRTNELEFIIPGEAFYLPGSYSIQVVAASTAADGIGYDSATGVMEAVTVRETAQDVELTIQSESDDLGLGDSVIFSIGSCHDGAVYSVRVDDGTGEVYYALYESTAGQFSHMLPHAGQFVFTPIAAVDGEIYEGTPITLDVATPSATSFTANGYKKYLWEMSGTSIHFEVRTNCIPFCVNLLDYGEIVGTFFVDKEQKHSFFFDYELGMAGQKHSFTISATGWKEEAIDLGMGSIKAYSLDTTPWAGKEVKVQNGAQLYTHPELVSGDTIDPQSIFTVQNGRFGDLYLIAQGKREYFVDKNDLTLVEGESAFYSEMSINLPTPCDTFNENGYIIEVKTSLYDTDDENGDIMIDDKSLMVFTMRLKPGVKGVDIVTHYVLAKDYDSYPAPVHETVTHWITNGSPDVDYTYRFYAPNAGQYILEFRPISDLGGFDTYNTGILLAIVNEGGYEPMYLMHDETRRLYVAPDSPALSDTVNYQTPLYIQGNAGNDKYYVHAVDVDTGAVIAKGFIEIGELSDVINERREIKGYFLITQHFESSMAMYTMGNNDNIFCSIVQDGMGGKALYIGGIDGLSKDVNPGKQNLQDVIDYIADYSDFNDVTYVAVLAHGNNNYFVYDDGKAIYYQDFCNMIKAIPGQVVMFMLPCLSGSMVTYLDQYEKDNGHPALDKNHFTVLAATAEDESDYADFFMTGLKKQYYGKEVKLGVIREEFTKYWSGLAGFIHPEYYGNNETTVFYAKP